MALTPWLSHFKTDFELARRRREESIAFDALRCEAFDRFLLLGCPTEADEQWRHIDIGPIARTNFSLGAAPSGIESLDQITPLALDDAGVIDLTFINGFFVPELSAQDELQGGAVVAPLKWILSAAGADDGSVFAQVARVDSLPFVALNTALFEDGACVIVPADTSIATRIHVRFVCNGAADAKPAMTQPRVLVVVGERGAATVIESYAGADHVEYFTNAVTEIALGANARLEHCRRQHESDAAYHISATHVIAGPGSTYSGRCMNTGGALVRTETMATLGDGAQCTIHAASTGKRDALVNVHTAIDHVAANSMSRQRYEWTLGDNAVGVVTGRTVVRAEATHARVRYVNRARLRSANARIEVKPAFDILASDTTFTQHCDIHRSSQTGSNTER